MLASRRTWFCWLALEAPASFLFAQQEGPWLIQEGDFRNPKGLPKAPETPKGIRTRNPGRALRLVTLQDEGPKVSVLRPENSQVVSPLDVRVVFAPRQHPVRLDTLRLFVDKEIAGAYWGRVDILPRIRQHVSEQGIALEKYKMPKGKYRIDLRIEDTAGNRSHGHVFLHVVA